MSGTSESISDVNRLTPRHILPASYQMRSKRADGTMTCIRVLVTGIDGIGRNLEARLTALLVELFVDRLLSA